MKNLIQKNVVLKMLNNTFSSSLYYLQCFYNNRTFSMHFTNAIIVTCFSESSDMSSHFIAVVDAKVYIILIHSPKTILVVCSLLPNTSSIILRLHLRSFQTTILSCFLDDGDRWQSSWAQVMPSAAVIWNFILKHLLRRLLLLLLLVGMWLSVGPVFC